MKKMPNIESIIFKQNSMIIYINGIEHCFELDKVSSKLLNATSIERNEYQISPANYGIHWPLIDQDLSIKKLLEK
jgi:hypothetical protein